MTLTGEEGLLPIAETTTTLEPHESAMRYLAMSSMRSALATQVPPNLCNCVVKYVKKVNWRGHYINVEYLQLNLVKNHVQWVKYVKTTQDSYAYLPVFAAGPCVYSIFR